MTNKNQLPASFRMKREVPTFCGLCGHYLGTRDTDEALVIKKYEIHPSYPCPKQERREMKYYKLIGWHEFRFHSYYILLRRRFAWPPMRIKRRHTSG